MTPELMIGASAAAFLLSAIALFFAMRNREGDESRLEMLSGTHLSHRSDGSQTRSRRSVSGSRNSVFASESQSTTDVSERLVQAGLYRRNSVTYYVAIKSCLALFPVAIGVGAGVMQWITLTQGLVAGAVLGIVGTLVPSFWLDMKKKKRQLTISRALPDALDVIVVCLEAGLSLRAALARVAKELGTAHPHLAAELMIVEREIQLGYSGGEALRRFANRFDMEELRSLSSVVMQAEKFGASIVKALRVHAESLRIKRFQLAEERAQKASVKLIFPTMFCIFPTLYVVLIGPAVIEMVRFFTSINKN